MGNSYETLSIGSETASVVFGGFMIFFLIFVLLVYVYTAICYMKIAKKTGTENAWMAWIPILNIILMLKVAGKPLWWIILFFIPLINILISILVWMAISKNVGKPNWLGILMLLPAVNLIILGYWAFSSKNIPTPVMAQPPTTPNPPQSQDARPFV